MSADVRVVDLPALPAGFVLVEAVGGADGDRHAAGRRAAAHAITLVHPDATLDYDGTRPIAVAGTCVPIALSITHTRTCVLAIAAPVARLGIDLVDDVDIARIARIAPRFLPEERETVTDPLELVVRFAATEAGLKAHGLGLVDGAVFDRACPLRVSSAPPRIDIVSSSGGEAMLLVLGRFGNRTLAIAFTHHNDGDMACNALAARGKL